MNKCNPFVIQGYKGKTYFCDREEETTRLVDYINNQVNVTLFAFRRLGKTGLIRHVFELLKSNKKIVCIYVDILGTNNLTEFINQLATGIYNAFPPNKSLGKKIIETIQSLRPIISFDELSGNPTVTFNSARQEQQANTMGQLFAFLDQQNVNVVFAIDEFQQILTYPEKNIEALLRTQMQQLKKTTFIYCGSNQKMMHEIFNSAKRPFFASCTNLYLDFIPKEKYVLFIGKTFKRYKKTITDDAVDFICEFTMLHTFYTQYFCNRLFTKNIDKININDVKTTALEILKVQEPTFYQYRNLLTVGQWKMLKAIAKHERLYQPNAKDFITTNNLGSPSMVTRGIEALLTKEMVFYDTAVEKPYYEVYNKYLMRWLQTK